MRLDTHWLSFRSKVGDIAESLEESLAGVSPDRSLRCMAGQRRPSLRTLAAEFKAEKPDRQELETLIAAAAQSKRLLHVLAWLLFEALSDENKNQLKGELRQSWAPTDTDLARLLKLGDDDGLPCLLWLIDQSPRCAEQLRRLWKLAEATGFRAPAEGNVLARVAAAPLAAVRAQRRRRLRRLLPVLC